MSNNHTKEKKKILKEKIKSEFIDSLIKYIVWTIPLSIILFLMNMIYSNVLFPSLKINSLQVEVNEDKQIVTEQNTNLPGRVLSINGNKYNYFAPELKILLRGKGQINSAYIIYEENEQNEESNKLLIQKVKDIKNSLTGYKINPNILNVTINLNLDKAEDGKIIYVVLLGKDNDKKIWCVYVNRREKNSIVKSAEEIYELMQYENSDKFSINREKILEQITEIYNLNL